VHPQVIGFIRFKPDAFFNMEGKLERGWPSPRSWERVSTMLHVLKNENTSTRRDLDIVIEGLVGIGVGLEFNAYREWSDKLENVLDLMLDAQKEIRIPERADQKYAICAAMVYHIWRAKSDKEQKLLIDGFFRISLKLSSDFATMAMVDAMNGPDQSRTDDYCKNLIEHSSYKKWLNLHGKALANKMNNS
jgi:hypothetical protein